MAAGTLAGTSIENTAIASYNGTNGRVEFPSNTVSFIVDEILDVALSASDTGDSPTQPGQTGQVLTFFVTNTGNGQEAFTLRADVAREGDDFDPSFVSIAFDSNSSGTYDAGIDTVYASGSNDPVIEPDTSVTVFVITNIPSDATDGQRAEVSLEATATTGSGNPGTSFEGQGEGGGDAVVGASGAQDEDVAFFVIESATVSLDKSVEIADPFGGGQAVPGATITYTLTASVNGTGSVGNLVISDSVPTGTHYVAESLKLDGIALTDNTTDADSGSFDGSAIAVVLGDIAGGESHAISFQVTINPGN